MYGVGSRLVRQGVLLTKFCSLIASPPPTLGPPSERCVVLIDVLSAFLCGL
jgi:hypothetical protein